MVRLFISIRFPEFIKEQLLDLYDLSLESASWIDIDQIHLTLKFIGEVDGLLFKEIQQSLTEIQGKSFSLSLKGVGFFPPRKKPRVLWVGASKEDLLLSLQHKIENKLNQINVPNSRRKFHPHVTLARLHHPPSHEIGLFLAKNSLFKTEDFLITTFSLYSSVLSSHGATHHEEAIYPLNPH